jgi:hypothetical protein
MLRPRLNQQHLPPLAGKLQSSQHADGAGADYGDLGMGGNGRHDETSQWQQALILADFDKSSWIKITGRLKTNRSDGL